MAAERQAEFTCTIPMLRLDQQQQEKLRIEQEEENKRWPEVSWKRNGRPLKVRWLNNGEAVVSSSDSARYLARQTKPGEFMLTLARAQPADDNATFTCLYRWPSGFLPPASEGDEESELARESGPIRLRVHGESAHNSGGQVKIDANLARPIDDLANAKNPHELPAKESGETNGTRLTEPTGIVVRRTLKQTLEDLYELAKPMLIIVGLLGFMSSIVLLYLTLIRRKTHNQNRYMKHQYVGSGASSNASSAIGGAPDCGDPVLSSLMARTLSAPSAVSLAGATKKYRSYRDHMRKVAAVQDHMMVGAEGDFIDGYFGPPPAHLQQISGSLSDQAPFFALPNLYNQSLAAREQARNLLQANEHVRSLSNLSQHQKQQQAASNGGSAARQQQTLGQMGSHLNLPLSFALGGPNGRLDQLAGCQGNISSALWPPHLNQNQQHAIGRFNGQQHPNHQLAKQRFADEQYQLVNCSSISPSSSNSGAASSGLSAGNDQDNHQMRKQAAEFGGESNCTRFDQQHQSRLDSSSQNHYSTIENNDDEDRYEEVEQGPGSQDICAINQRSSFRTDRVSSFVKTDQRSEHVDTSSNANNILKNSTRSSILSNSSSSGCGDSTNTTTSSSLSGDLAANRVGSKRVGRQHNQSKTILQQDNKRGQQFQDQLSPYAVSSICSSIPPTHQPPPVPDSEAMQALYEQFDINQLMLLDESNPVPQTLAFDTLPPPPPAPTDSFVSSQIEDRANRSQTRKKS